MRGTRNVNAFSSIRTNQWCWRDWAVILRTTVDWPCCASVRSTKLTNRHWCFFATGCVISTVTPLVQYYCSKGVTVEVTHPVCYCLMFKKGSRSYKKSATHPLLHIWVTHKWLPNTGQGYVLSHTWVPIFRALIVGEVPYNRTLIFCWVL